MLITEENVFFKYFILQKEKQASSMIKPFIIVSLKLAKLMPSRALWKISWSIR